MREDEGEGGGRRKNMKYQEAGGLKRRMRIGGGMAASMEGEKKVPPGS